MTSDSTFAYPALRIEVTLLPGMPTNLNSRLYCMAIALLDTLHRYLWGALTHDQKCIQRDVLIPPKYIKTYISKCTSVQRDNLSLTAGKLKLVTSSPSSLWYNMLSFMKLKTCMPLCHNWNLADFKKALRDFKHKLLSNPTIRSHLAALYNTLLQQKLLRITLTAYLLSHPPNLKSLDVSFHSVIEHHIALHPEDAARFPNFLPTVPPSLQSDQKDL
ncbi:hypothetical protein EDD22DRAFT_847244 [Suillus occidentalis]|nr:hypothetical protein EDD22DRAFT_847244 [Suillus occidentalis]